MRKQRPAAWYAWPQRWRNRFKRTLLAGFVVLVPIALTVYLLDLLVGTADRLVSVVPEGFRPPESLLFPGAGIVGVVVLAWAAGVVATSVFGRFVVPRFNQLVERIPLVASVYRLLRQLAEALLTSDGKKGFKRVVLVEWPRRGSWMLAFVASETRGELQKRLAPAAEDEGFLNLLVPTTPNPTSGFSFMVRKSEVIELDMAVEAAFQIVLSGGTLSTEDIVPRKGAGTAGSGGEDR